MSNLKAIIVSLESVVKQIEDVKNPPDLKKATQTVPQNPSQWIWKSIRNSLIK